MKELIKSVLTDLKKKEGFIFITDDGEEITLQEAAKKGVSITPKNPKVEAQKRLAKAGLDLTDPALIKDIMEVIELLGSGKSIGSKKSTRTAYSETDKINYVKELRAAEAKNKEVNPSRFAREKGLNYQTLTSWVKKYSNKI